MPLISATSHLAPGDPAITYHSSHYSYYPTAKLNNAIPTLDNDSGSCSSTEFALRTHYHRPIIHGEPVIHSVDQPPYGFTLSPQQRPFVLQGSQRDAKFLPYESTSVDAGLYSLLIQHPAIPQAVPPACFTPPENTTTLAQSLFTSTNGNYNVYIHGLHPNTTDETLAAYVKRFGKVQSSKVIINFSTRACKGFGFAKYHNIHEARLCIRGFYELGYEVSFARESFNSRLNAMSDEESTSLYISNIPKDMTESELSSIFGAYIITSIRILPDNQNYSRSAGFVKFKSRTICKEVIERFNLQAIGKEGFLLQVRYADTPAQKELKRVTVELSHARAYARKDFIVNGSSGEGARDMQKHLEQI